MKYRIKMVPQETPNADGEWREVEALLPPYSSWLDLAMALDQYVPETHFLVAMERVAPPPRQLYVAGEPIEAGDLVRFDERGEVRRVRTEPPSPEWSDYQHLRSLDRDKELARRVRP